MTEKIVVKEVAIEEAVKVNAAVDEFSENNGKYDKPYFESRYKGKQHLILVAYVNNHPAGYVVAYDRFADGSFFCWMAGTVPKHRGRGALKAMMDYTERWAKQKGYKKIKIKTRNSRREMLSYMVKYGFYFTTVTQHKDIKDNRILVEKDV